MVSNGSSMSTKYSGKLILKYNQCQFRVSAAKNILVTSYEYADGQLEKYVGESLLLARMINTNRVCVT